MSKAAMEWAMQPDEGQPGRPTMCAEKRLFVIRLAWQAWHTPGKGEVITDEIHKLAKLAGISVRAAREAIVRACVTESISVLRNTNANCAVCAVCAIYQGSSGSRSRYSAIARNEYG